MSVIAIYQQLTCRVLLASQEGVSGRAGQYKRMLSEEAREAGERSSGRGRSPPQANPWLTGPYQYHRAVVRRSSAEPIYLIAVEVTIAPAFVLICNKDIPPFTSTKLKWVALP